MATFSGSSASGAALAGGNRHWRWGAGRPAARRSPVGIDRLLPGAGPQRNRRDQRQATKGQTSLFVAFAAGAVAALGSSPFTVVLGTSLAGFGSS